MDSAKMNSDNSKNEAAPKEEAVPEKEVVPKIYDICVVGSSIIDNICYVPNLPKSGDTVKATNFKQGFGGKGANQCVAAAKLGSKTVLISKLGDDESGRKYKEHLKKYNVNIDYMGTAPSASTGVAQISVADSNQGENQIVIVPGANDTLTVADVDKCTEDVLNKSKVLIVQLETPMQPTLAALRQFKKYDKDRISILNAAPIPASNSLELFTLPTVLCVNRSEASALATQPIESLQDGQHALETFITLGCKIVIITLGKDGALFATSKDPKAVHVRPPPVEEVLDTTGAGDAFVGALAHYMHTYPDLPLFRHVAGAVHIATKTVQQYGTQSSYPSAKDARIDIANKTFDYYYISP